MSPRRSKPDPWDEVLAPPRAGPAPSHVPDIAAPVLLDPIPEPTMLGVGSVSGPVVDEDPYAWAAAAASSMERAGRIFDTDAFHAPPEPQPDPWEQAAPPREPLPQRAPARPPAAPQERRPAVVRAAQTADTRPEVSKPKGIAWPVLGVAAAVAGFLVVIIAVAALTWTPPEPEQILRPVTADLDGGAGAPDEPFARPPADYEAPPGAQVGFRGRDEPGMGSTPVTQVEIRSDPPGALVRIDGRGMGVSPMLARLSPGTHDLELSLAGHGTLRRDVDVGAERLLVDLQLPKATGPGRIRVTATGWEGSRLIVDGRVKGVVPVIIELTPGMHRFVVDRGPRQFAVEQHVSVDPARLGDLDLTIE